MSALTKYRLTSEKLKGSLILVYKDEKFYSLLNEFKQDLNIEQCKTLRAKLPYLEADILELKKFGFKVEKVTSKTNEKIALFCDKYKDYNKGLKYKVSPADSGKIKYVIVNEELLKVYFTSENFLFKGKYSISNYVRYFNELNQELARIKSGTNVKNKFPDRYNADYERKLSGNELSQYWAHLRSLGYKAVKKRGITVWE